LHQYTIGTSKHSADECKPLLHGWAIAQPGAKGIEMKLDIDSRTGNSVPRGEAMQVDPTKPTLKAPETKRLKLKRYVQLSNFAFNFNLRNYTGASVVGPGIFGSPRNPTQCAPLCRE